jgi:hypothetical protein
MDTHLLNDDKNNKWLLFIRITDLDTGRSFSALGSDLALETTSKAKSTASVVRYHTPLNVIEWCVKVKSKGKGINL